MSTETVAPIEEGIPDWLADALGIQPGQSSEPIVLEPQPSALQTTLNLEHDQVVAMYQEHLEQVVPSDMETTATAVKNLVQKMESASQLGSIEEVKRTTHPLLDLHITLFGSIDMAQQELLSDHILAATTNRLPDIISRSAYHVVNNLFYSRHDDTNVPEALYLVTVLDFARKFFNGHHDLHNACDQAKQYLREWAPVYNYRPEGRVLVTALNGHNGHK